MDQELTIMKTYHPENIADWHHWLLEHAATEQEIWLIFYKSGSEKPGISYEEAVEEALCFGWVDSLIKNLDQDSHARKFTPRRSGSPWSELNIARAKRMVDAGRMTEAGLKLFQESVDHRALGGQSRKEQMEQWRMELVTMLSPEVLEKYHSLAPSLQRQYAGYVMSARKPETQQKRIAELSEVLLKGEKLGLK